MAEQMKCPVCGIGDLVGEERVRATDIGGVSTDVAFRTHYCKQCGLVQGLDEDLRFNARAMRRATKKQKMLLTGDEVRALRKRLCLTQEQAAKLFGGGPVAFSKYENDEVSQSEAMDRLIWLISEYPWLLASLARYVGIVLSEQVSLVIEKFRTAYHEEYLIQAQARVRNARVVFQGYGQLAPASNDSQIYRPNAKSKPVRWSSA